MQQVTEEYNNKSLAKLNRQAWTRAGVAVNAGSASEAAKQAGLDWNVMLADMQAYVSNKVNEFESVTDYYPVPKKQAVIKIGRAHVSTPVTP